jgi:hypothetical protein
LSDAAPIIKKLEALLGELKASTGATASPMPTTEKSSPASSLFGQIFGAAHGKSWLR